jgi:hypothetical protein
MCRQVLIKTRWLDLHTFIMEPTYSLQSHIFDDLTTNTYRDITIYNPLNITHPLTDSYLDAESLSPVGDDEVNGLTVFWTSGGIQLVTNRNTWNGNTKSRMPLNGCIPINHGFDRIWPSSHKERSIVFP